MNRDLFGSQLWRPALEKYTAATGLAVALFEADGGAIPSSIELPPLVALFREFGCEPGLLAGCAADCLRQASDRPEVLVVESNGLAAVGTPLVLDGAIVGAAVAGYALARFSQVPTVQRWARSSGVPFDRLWNIVRNQPPVPERRLKLHGALLQVLGEALLRENHRTRQYEDATVKLQAAAAAKDEFLAVLSHELRTPLAPIVGWASILKQEATPAQVQKAAEIIERNAFLQSRMIDDLLDVTRVSHGGISLELAPLEIHAVMRAALEPFAEAIATKSIRLEVAEAGEPLTIEGDFDRLQQVFRNILSNAVKFTPTHGELRIAISRDASDVLVRIADTGRGIEPEFVPFAFEIFRQQQQGTHRAREGLGIGLSLVKSLTELHKGSVGIASPGPGLGTEVTVRLPLATAALIPDPGPASTAPAVMALAGLSILVVEDSDDAREFERILLERLGARVSVAANGREGLGLLHDAEMPDVVLCDLLMPVLDGYEFIRALGDKPGASTPPVIAVTGLDGAASRERVRKAGFAGHVGKPFTESAVVSAIATALESRRVPRSTPGHPG